MKRPQLKEDASADDVLICLADVAEELLNQVEEYDGDIDFDNETNTAFTMYEMVMEELYGKEIWDYIDGVIKEKQRKYEAEKAAKKAYEKSRFDSAPKKESDDYEGFD